MPTPTITSSERAERLPEPIWRTRLRGNPVLVGMLAAALALQLAVSTRPSRKSRRHHQLTDAQLAVGAGFSLAIHLLMEINEALSRQPKPRTAPASSPTVPDLGGALLPAPRAAARRRGGPVSCDHGLDRARCLT